MDDVLSKLPLFAALSHDAGTALRGAMKREQFNRGDVIFDEGDQGDRLYAVIEGKVKIARTAAMLGQWVTERPSSVSRRYFSAVENMRESSTSSTCWPEWRRNAGPRCEFGSTPTSSNTPYCSRWAALQTSGFTKWLTRREISHVT